MFRGTVNSRRHAVSTATDSERVKPEHGSKCGERQSQELQKTKKARNCCDSMDMRALHGCG